MQQLSPIEGDIVCQTTKETKNINDSGLFTFPHLDLVVFFIFNDSRQNKFDVLGDTTRDIPVCSG